MFHIPFMSVVFFFIAEKDFLQNQKTFCSVASFDRVNSWFLKIFQFLSASCASNNLKQLYFRNINAQS